VTDSYAVIGNPIAHSKSPQIHHAFARQLGDDLEYTIIECPPDGFLDAVSKFRSHGGRGMNVTTPFKLEAFALADELSDRAESAGSVNTLRFDSDAVVADNFDGVGFVRDVTVNLGMGISARRVLVLGAGGAARGLRGPIADEGPSELLVVNRSLDKARQVVDGVEAGALLRVGGYDDLRGEAFDLVVNATSASMHGELPPVTVSTFRPGGVAYDLAYGLGLTPFLELARSAGVARVVDGVGMLVEQAAEAFAWWRGTRPETRAMIDALTVPLD